MGFLSECLMLGSVAVKCCWFTDLTNWFDKSMLS